MKLAGSLLALSTVTVMSGAALGADLIIDVAPPEVFEAASPVWAGPYVGAHLGYMWGDVELSEDEEPSEGTIGGPIEGLIGGLFAGINLEDGGFVYGLEADFGIGAVSGEGGVVAQEPDEDYLYDLNWNAHLRGRVGFAVDQLLFFVAGGLAVASHTLTSEYPDNEIGEDTQLHVGWTLGAGIEAKVTDNVAVRAEYLYDDYGTRTYTFEDYDEYDARITAHTFRVGASVSF